MMFRASPFNAAMLMIVQITRTVSGSHFFDTNSSDTLLYINRTDFISSMKGIRRWAVTRSLPPGPRLSRVYEYNKNKLLRYSYLGIPAVIPVFQLFLERAPVRASAVLWPESVLPSRSSLAAIARCEAALLRLVFTACSYLTIMAHRWDC